MKRYRLTAVQLMATQVSKEFSIEKKSSGYLLHFGETGYAKNFTNLNEIVTYLNEKKAEVKERQEAFDSDPRNKRKPIKQVNRDERTFNSQTIVDSLSRDISIADVDEDNARYEAILEADKAQAELNAYVSEQAEEVAPEVWHNVTVRYSESLNRVVATIEMTGKQMLAKECVFDSDYIDLLKIHGSFSLSMRESNLEQLPTPPSEVSEDNLEFYNDSERAEMLNDHYMGTLVIPSEVSEPTPANNVVSITPADTLNQVLTKLGYTKKHVRHSVYSLIKDGVEVFSGSVGEIWEYLRKVHEQAFTYVLPVLTVVNHPFHAASKDELTNSGES